MQFNKASFGKRLQTRLRTLKKQKERKNLPPPSRQTSDSRTIHELEDEDGNWEHIHRAYGSIVRPASGDTDGKSLADDRLKRKNDSANVQQICFIHLILGAEYPSCSVYLLLIFSTSYFSLKKMHRQLATNHLRTVYSAFKTYRDRFNMDQLPEISVNFQQSGRILGHVCVIVYSREDLEDAETLEKGSILQVFFPPNGAISTSNSFTVAFVLRFEPPIYVAAALQCVTYER